jgi:hypothetical protein
MENVVSNRNNKPMMLLLLRTPSNLVHFLAPLVIRGTVAAFFASITRTGLTLAQLSGPLIAADITIGMR